MKKLLCIILTAAMLLALCACGSGSKKNAATYNDAGYYEIFSVDEGDETLTSSDFKDMDWHIYLQLNDDGTGVLDMDDGDVTELTWKDGTINDGISEIPYVLAGGMLTLDLSDDSDTFVMIFKKGSAPAAEEPAEEAAAGVSGFADRFSRSGNAEEPEEEVKEEAESAPEPADTNADDKKPAAPAGDFTPVSGKVDGNDVTILAAEAFTDHDDKDAVRFYYEFTNNSDEPTSAYIPLYFEAEEDGYELVTTYASYEDDVPEYGNDSMYVMPGATIRCIKEFSFKSDGDELTFTISDYGDDEVTATFDPKALPGRPGDWTPEINPDLTFYLTGNSDEGSSEAAHVFIDDGELVDEYSAYGNGRVARIYFEYTNLEDEESYFRDECMIKAFQDGVELDYGYPEDDADTDGNDYEDVAPDDTLTVSLCWLLRSDSPVEVVVLDFWSDDVICAAQFTIN